MLIQINNFENSSSASSVSVTQALPVRAGDTTVLAIYWNTASVTISSITDSAGNSYTSRSSQLNFNTSNNAAIYDCISTNAWPAGNVITVNFSAGATFRSIIAAEYNGMTFDSAASANATASTSPASGNTAATNATTGQQEQLVGYIAVGANALTSVASGFTTQVNTSINNFVLIDQIVSVPGNYQASGTCTSSFWAAFIAAYKIKTKQTNPPYVVSAPEPYAILRGDGTTVSQDSTSRGVTVPPLV